MVANTSNEYFRALIEWEAEGERTPAQIRADFDRGGFCLVASSGEPIGKLYHQYKHAALAREWLAAEVRS